MIIFAAACYSAPVENGYIPLFNGKDLEGFEIMQRNATEDEAKKIYTIDPDGSLHLFRDLPDRSNEQINRNGTHGILYTEKSYSRYSLQFEYKWGDKRFNNHDQFQYDSGLIYHIQNLKIWPTALQYQIRFNHEKNQNHTGDIVAGGVLVEWHTKDGKTFDWPENGAKRKPDSRGQLFAKANATFHALDGEWNECEVIVMGDKYLLHKLNGQFVNMATNLAASEGPIAFEAETAEIYWRNVRIKEFEQDIPIEEFLK